MAQTLGLDLDLVLQGLPPLGENGIHSSRQAANSQELTDGLKGVEESSRLSPISNGG